MNAAFAALNPFSLFPRVLPNRYWGPIPSLPDQSSLERLSGRLGMVGPKQGQLLWGVTYNSFLEGMVTAP